MVPATEQRHFLRTFYEMANQKAPDNLVDVHEVGTQCGLDDFRSEVIAQVLVDEGILEHEGTFPAYRLTPKGLTAAQEALIGFKPHKPLPPRLNVHISTLGEPDAAMVTRLEPEDYSAIAGAVALLHRHLESVEGIASDARAELLEVVHDLTTELQQSEPNGTRLRGLLLGLASAMALDHVSETVEHDVKVALSLLSIDLWL